MRLIALLLLASLCGQGCSSRVTVESCQPSPCGCASSSASFGALLVEAFVVGFVTIASDALCACR